MEDKNESLEKDLDMNVWKSFYPYLKPYKKDFAILMIFVISLGVIDSIFPLLNKSAVDNFINNNNIQGLGLFVVKYLIAIGGLSFTVYSFIKYSGKIESKMAYDIRKLGFEKLQTLSLDYYDEKAVGWLMSRMTSDINRLSEIISWGLLDIAWGLSLMTSITFFMFRLNVKLAIATLISIPVLLFVSKFFQRRILSAQRAVRNTNSKITAAFNEDIQGAKTTKSLAREDLNLKEFSNITTSMRDKSIKAVVNSSIYIPIVLLLGSVSTALVITIGGNDVLKGAISYGTLLAFMAYATQFFDPINQIAILFSELQTAQAATERIFDLLNEVPSIKDSEEVIEKYGDLLNPKRENWPKLKGNIEFLDVGFSYNDKEIILKNFNLKVDHGQTIALVGETGSGKSTIVNLISRFYEPTEGKILIDGRDYKSLPQNYIHENLGYVLQSPHLFNGSVRENILYGYHDASEEDILRASKLVDAHSFIEKMEHGYDSQVGEGDLFLSTGKSNLYLLQELLYEIYAVCLG